MRISDFIRENRGEIADAWQDFAATLRPSAGMNDLQLKDHIDEILTFIADDIETAQTPSEQFQKSQGRQESDGRGTDSAAQTHAALRHTDGFDIVEMVSEYRALRASVTKLWTRAKNGLTEDDVMDLDRFNEAIDQALAESVLRFTQDVDKAKDLLLGVLGHDIRSPVSAIQMSAAMVARVGNVNRQQTQLLEQIEVSAERVQVIVHDLLDLAKSKAGQGLPLKKTQCSLPQLCSHIVDEMKVRYSDHNFHVVIPSHVEGFWDRVRLGQLLSNLLTNAVQYGDADIPITVHGGDEGDDVVLAVTNGGEAIPATHLDTIFKSFTRVAARGSEGEVPTSNLGLGLFIAKEIAAAHGGTITVTSSRVSGTTFCLRIPKFSDGRAGVPDVARSQG